jgi:hypothetical protein
MMRGLNIAEQIHQLLLKNTIMSLKQLRAELPGRARSSLFRDLKTDFTSAKTAKPLASSGLGGNFGFHRDGYILTSNKFSICFCSSVGVLFWSNSMPFTATLLRVIWAKQSITPRKVQRLFSPSPSS